MINITPTFHHEYDNTYRGIPENFNTNLSVPREYDNKGRNIPLSYVDTPRFPNPFFLLNSMNIAGEQKLN